MSYQTVKNSRERLKHRILYVMGEKCQCCGYDKCSSALELHHINPKEKSFTISTNTNRGWNEVLTEIKKCTLVCANCHREIEAGLIESPKSSFNQDKANEVSQLIEDIKSKKIYYCQKCGKEVYKGSTYCPECSHFLQRKSERPSREELKKLIREESFTQIGKQFNVSDNTIRKWCISEGLPKTKKEINSYSEDEWNLL